MNPLVSIITPLYNAEAYFSQTAASVLNQTYKTWEWIIVDDCSTDGSFDLAKNIASKDERITLIKLEKNKGSAAARNKGLDLAKGKYVSFLDADDLLDNVYLEKQVSFIAYHGPIISCAYRRMTPNSNTVYSVPEKVDYQSILHGNPLSCLSTMFDREIFSNERFSEDMLRHEDYLFWINILKQGYVAYGNKEVLATYRIVRESKNSSKSKLVKPLYRLYRQKLGFGIIKSFIMVAQYVKYSKKKYKDVK